MGVESRSRRMAIRRPALLFASLLSLGLASPQRGGRQADTNLCQYRCTDGGGCEVHYTGRPRRGKTKGSCFPFSFGGGCSGTPRECLDCNRAITCRESDNNNNNGFGEAVDDSGFIAVEEVFEEAIGPVALSEEDCLASCLASGAGAQECISSCVGEVETRRPANNRRPVLKIFDKELPTPSLTGLSKPSSSQETRSSLKEEVAGGTCVTICDNWPHAQCKVGLERRNGGYQAATCINPYTGSTNRFNNQPQKFSNYPECASIPQGCRRCDETCALRDGKNYKLDY